MIEIAKTFFGISNGRTQGRGYASYRFTLGGVMSVSSRTLTGSRLLAALSGVHQERLRAELDFIPLPLREVLYEPLETICYIYFPVDGVVSIVALMEDGLTAEVGLVGKEGMVGVPVLLGMTTTPNRAIVQLEGSSLRMEAGAFRSYVTKHPSVERYFLRYAQLRLSQVSLIAACNGLHRIEQRLARWLLMVGDRMESDSFFLTQEYAATMLAVRRAGVTHAAGLLQKAGIINYVRGHVTILDRPKLESISCECYRAGKSYARLAIYTAPVPESAGKLLTAVAP